MQSNEFHQYFKNSIFNNYFLGVFSSDNYPQSLEPNQFFVFNKDKSNEPGSHWLACFFNGDHLEFFDSLGCTKNYVKNLLSFSKNYTCFFNETRLQPSNSNSCGHFCIYFLYKRFLGRDMSLKYCLNSNFSLDLIKNDQKVKKFCDEILL